jgi:cyanophycinase
MMATGLGFLENTIVDQHFLKRNRKDRLHAALKLHPELVGVGIDEDTALVCRNGSYEVIGNSSVLLCLGATSNREALTETIASGQKFDLRPWTVAAAGRARHGAYSIAEVRPVPNLKKGAVVIAGPRPPKEAVQEFLTAAGGKTASLVLVSETKETAESENRLREYFTEMGVENLMVCSATDSDTMSDPKTVETFAHAQGVWFVGAEQERLLDLVVRSSLQKVVGDVLARGGAIGGSSAGASIHGDGIVRRKTTGTAATVPANSHDAGLGVLTGVVIDQCDVDEETSDNMATVLRDRFPNCIGLGLKESAAVVVRGHTMQVVGSEPVSVFDNARDGETTAVDQKIPAGQTYDFVARRVVTASLDSSP